MTKPCARNSSSSWKKTAFTALLDRHSPRWRLHQAERKVLAEKGKPLGKLLSEVITIVQPETLLKWHRRLTASKWDFSSRRAAKPGRPFVPPNIDQWVLQFARENPGRGYDRIVGAVANLGHQISSQGRRQYSESTRFSENEMERRAGLLDGAADGTDA